MNTRTELSFLLLALAACSSTSTGGGSAGGGGTSDAGTTTSGPSSATGDAATSTTTGAGGQASVGSTGSSGGAGGAGEVQPTPEECEQYDNEEDCHAAGCRLFYPVVFVTEGTPDVCADSTGVERDMCLQLDPEETYSYPAGATFYRPRGNLGYDVILMNSSYCGLLGWTPCIGGPDPADDPTPLCTCIGSVCPSP